MFDGVSEQLQQFIASSSSRTRTSLPIPLIHGNTTTYLYSSNQPLFLHHPSPTPIHTNVDVVVQTENNNNDISLLQIPTGLGLDLETNDPWSNDELLALFRIRSTLQNWLPDFTWEHVSRKLAELGFKKSAEKCRQKFEEEEEERRYFNTNINSYKFVSELDQLCHGDIIQDKQNVKEIIHNSNTNVEKQQEKAIDEEEVVIAAVKKSQIISLKKRKRKFEILKCFCENVVKKIMAQQEELHNKIIDDLVKRDEENIAREEAWKKQELDRHNKDILIRANEQAIASARQATINDLLNNFDFFKAHSISSPTTILAPNPNLSSPTQNNMPNSSTLPQADQTPTSPNYTQKNPSIPNLSITHQNPNLGSSVDDDNDRGKRWPRDEVLALINIRTTFYNNNEDKEGCSSAKGPLWEKISQGMLNLGYKRNAKRCKEKWENINKYYRKTKDNVNKKRCFDSRTCPYFHQLTNLYKQGSPLMENHQSLLATQLSPEMSNKHDDDDQGEKNMIEAPSFNFEF